VFTKLTELPRNSERIEILIHWIGNCLGR
jgi:hypothetical protein